MAARSCSASLVPDVPNIPGINATATCVGIDRCPGVVDNPQAPTTHIVACGFDDTDNMMMVCCPDEMVEEKKTVVQEPSFPERNGRSRSCEDRSEFCSKWKSNGGCSLDRHIEISKQDTLNGKANSRDLFGFMQLACPDTCGWCGDKGCRDEHPRCPAWSRIGMCVLSPFFMAHTCRESCGVCGFLSPHNQEEQVVGKFSYSDFTRTNFDCGRYKPLCEVNKTPCEPTSLPSTAEGEGSTNFDLRGEGNDDIHQVFTSAQPNNKREFFCGATMIADKWAVSAAHCYDDFASAATNEARKVRINTVRDGTEHVDIVEVKRVYKHPGYRYPVLYDDVAVLELGRRVEYGFDKFGDTPTCMDRGMFEKEGRLATLQGFGTTEKGTKGALLEANVTVISDTYCQEILSANTSSTSITLKEKITKAIPLGLRHGLLCAQGIYNEEKFSDACKGDSGGPLLQQDPDGKTTLIGIVSGGIDCGKGFPGWYSKVEFHKIWIRCIVDQSIRFKNVKSKVEEQCKSVVEVPKTCEESVQDTNVALFDLRNIGLTAKEACEDYNTNEKVDEEIFE